jgi:hypothetical protein
MFSKIFTLAFVATAVVAAPAPWDGGSGGSTTGTPQCCQTVKNSSDPAVAALVFALLGLDVSGLNIPIGQGCSGISAVGGVSCNQNPVTCGSVYQGMLAIICRLANHTDSCTRRAHRAQLRPHHRQRMKTQIEPGEGPSAQRCDQYELAACILCLNTKTMYYSSQWIVPQVNTHAMYLGARGADYLKASRLSHALSAHY